MRDEENALSYVVGIGILLCLVALMLWPFAVQARVVGLAKSQSGDSITLTDEACKAKKVIPLIKPEFLNRFHAATYYQFQADKKIEGCYFMDGEIYFIVFDDGDQLALPISAFKQVKI